MFTPEPWQGYGYDDQTKGVLAGGKRAGRELAWGDTHHPALSETGGDYDGRFLFIGDKANARMAVIDLHDFATRQIVTTELVGSDHGAAFVTPNTEYVIETTQYPTPLGGEYADPAKDFYDPSARIIRHHAHAARRRRTGGAWRTRMNSGAVSQRFVAPTQHRAGRSPHCTHSASPAHRAAHADGGAIETSRSASRSSSADPNRAAGSRASPRMIIASSAHGMSRPGRRRDGGIAESANRRSITSRSDPPPNGVVPASSSYKIAATL